MHSVFPDLQLTNDIGRTAIKRRAVVRIAIAGWLHGWSNIGELRDIREFLVGTVPDNMLHKNRWIRWSPKSLGSDFHPPDIAFRCREFESVHVGRRKEIARDIAGQCNLLNLRGCIVWLHFGIHRDFCKACRWPGEGVHRHC